MWLPDTVLTHSGQTAIFLVQSDCYLSELGFRRSKHSCLIVKVFYKVEFPDKWIEIMGYNDELRAKLNFGKTNNADVKKWH